MPGPPIWPSSEQVLSRSRNGYPNLYCTMDWNIFEVVFLCTARCWDRQTLRVQTLQVQRFIYRYRQILPKVLRFMDCTPITYTRNKGLWQHPWCLRLKKVVKNLAAYVINGWRTFQPRTFQPQVSTPDLSTKNYSTMNFLTPDFSTINFSTPDFSTPDFPSQFWGWKVHGWKFWGWKAQGEAWGWKVGG